LNQTRAGKTTLVAAFMFVLFLVAGCATGPTIRSNLDNTVDFSKFRTFGFLDPLSTDRDGYQTLVSQQLVASTDRELRARGLQRSDSNPDLLVNFSANLDQRLRITQTPTVPISSIDRRHHRGFYSTWPTHQQTEVRQYTQGTLGIDIVDASRRQLIWEGFAVGRVTQRTTDNLGTVLDSAVVDIFADFPVQPK
jgi:hypothetical protein